MLDLRRLRLLSEFAERGTIAATATALGYTPSAVSQQLAALEREAGATLLDRTARSAELTDAGRRLADHAERILPMIEAAEADLSDAGAAGRVAITAFPTAAVAFAPALAHSLRAIRADPSAAAEPARRGHCARSGPARWTSRWSTTGRAAAARSVGSLRVFPLLRDPLVLVVPRRHRLADPTVPVDLRQLRDEPWMATPDGEPSRQAVDRLLADVGGAPPVPWEFEGLGTILSLVPRHRDRRRAPAGAGRRGAAGRGAELPDAGRPGTSTRWRAHRA